MKYTNEKEIVKSWILGLRANEAIELLMDYMNNESIHKIYKYSVPNKFKREY